MSRAFRQQTTESNTHYPRLLGTHGAVTSEHYLATQAGADLLKAGGNAVDAAVGAVLVEGVVNPQMHTLGGECPILICMAETGRVVSINGNTAAPERATPEAYRQRGLSEVPETGILAAGVPATLGALLTALREFGTLAFAEVVAPALDCVRNGFPVHEGLFGQERYGLRDLADQFKMEWPASATVYLPNGTVPQVGEVIRNSVLADLFDHLKAAESRQSGNREAGLQAVLEAFYKGDPASEIERFSQERDGLLARSDCERFETHLEEPAALDFADTTVFKCGPWNQGPVLLQALAILENFDLRGMGHNSTEYLHWATEAVKLAFADREQFYGDPRQVDVPLAGLLSKDYARLRAELIDPERANPELRPGDPRNQKALLPVEERLGGASWGPGTVHVDVIDGEGNMVAFTPSGGWLKSSEVVPALGFPLGNRLMTFYLEPAQHPNLIAPGKRPRTTISPSLAFRNGKPWMVWGSMGGDQQDQWQLQFFLNRVVFGMTVQQAIEAPKFSSEHFPGFFTPHDRFPNLLRVEPRIPVAVREELERRGHEIAVGADWSEGYLLAAARDPESGVLEAGCDPRGTKGEVFPAFALCW
ncbi:MAG TPA: gamma-glutamyltransferase family protein [Candidatus Lambdaproteobacteria bacterium]|nr:gamma-glutamyltransferase family protein [Candidatus Lambdaproteobacteria bacterium]